MSETDRPCKWCKQPRGWHTPDAPLQHAYEPEPNQNEQAWEDLRADGGLPESHHQSTGKFPGKMGLTAESRPDDVAYAAGWNECLDEATAAYDTLAESEHRLAERFDEVTAERDALAQQLQQAQDEIARLKGEGQG